MGVDFDPVSAWREGMVWPSRSGRRMRVLEQGDWVCAAGLEVAHVFSSKVPALSLTSTPLQDWQEWVALFEPFSTKKTKLR